MSDSMPTDGGSHPISFGVKPGAPLTPSVAPTMGLLQFDSNPFLDSAMKRAAIETTVTDVADNNPFLSSVGRIHFPAWEDAWLHTADCSDEESDGDGSGCSELINGADPISTSIAAMATLRRQRFDLPPSPASMWHPLSPSNMAQRDRVADDTARCEQWWNKMEAASLLQSPPRMRDGPFVTVRSLIDTAEGDEKGADIDSQIDAPLELCAVVTAHTPPRRIGGGVSRVPSSCLHADVHTDSPILSPFSALPQCFGTPGAPPSNKDKANHYSHGRVRSGSALRGECVAAPGSAIARNATRTPRFMHSARKVTAAASSARRAAAVGGKDEHEVEPARRSNAPTSASWAPGCDVGMMGRQRASMRAAEVGVADEPAPALLPRRSKGSERIPVSEYEADDVCIVAQLGVGSYKLRRCGPTPPSANGNSGNRAPIRQHMPDIAVDDSSMEERQSEGAVFCTPEIARNLSAELDRSVGDAAKCSAGSARDTGTSGEGRLHFDDLTAAPLATSATGGGDGSDALNFSCVEEAHSRVTAPGMHSSPYGPRTHPPLASVHFTTGGASAWMGTTSFGGATTRRFPLSPLQAMREAQGAGVRRLDATWDYARLMTRGEMPAPTTAFGSHSISSCAATGTAGMGMGKAPLYASYSSVATTALDSPAGVHASRLLTASVCGAHLASTPAVYDASGAAWGSMFEGANTRSATRY